MKTSQQRRNARKAEQCRSLGWCKALGPARIPRRTGTATRIALRTTGRTAP